jgi:hypothetical protein
MIVQMVVDKEDRRRDMLTPTARADEGSCRSVAQDKFAWLVM